MIRMKNMNDKKIFSKYYSSDSSRYEDKPRFRDRILKYMEDYINSEDSLGSVVFRKCRSEMGLNLIRAEGVYGYVYLVELLC